MKRFFLILCLFLSKLSTTSAQIIKLKVISVPLFVSTPYRIACDQFEKRFGDKKEVCVKSLFTIRKVKKMLSKFTPAKEITGIDVRGKLVVFYTNKQIHEICFDQFGHFFMKGIVYKNKELLSFLLEEKMIEENAPVVDSHRRTGN